MKRLVLVLRVFCVLLIGLYGFKADILHPSIAFALSGNSFQPGKIIDDAAMQDKNALTVVQVQTLLNDLLGSNGQLDGQDGSCDTNGNKIFIGLYKGRNYTATDNVMRRNLDPMFPAPYVCLNQYQEDITTHQNNLGGQSVPNGLSAAQIIINASQSYGINPKVLLVMLQKESDHLLTDDWPWPTQYVAAMGYGCPDGSSCNTAYAGFANQVMGAAFQMRQYYTNPTNYNFLPASQVVNPSNVDGHVNILYHPSPSSCGSQSVVIQNQATANLYNYTPYVPNNAALLNLYGSGDICSSYGNRNFWQYYTSWFGTTFQYFYGKPSAESSYANQPCRLSDFISSQIGRLYNPDTQDYLYTTSHDEACQTIKLGYIWDGVVMQSATDPNAIPVYRLANTVNHFFTTDPSVRDDYISNHGYHSEGIAFYADALSNNTNTIPVHMLRKNATIFLTSSGGEAINQEQNNGYIDTGIVFYTPNLNTKGTVFRLQNASDRLYTTNQVEVTVAEGSYGYYLEGTDILADTSPSITNQPVYRLSGVGGHFYTENPIERDADVIAYGYQSEGIGFYSPPASIANVRPVYRMTNYLNPRRLYTLDLYEVDSAFRKFNYALEGVSWYSYGS